MRTEALERVTVDLLEELGVAAPVYRLGELERHHVLERRRGSLVSYVVARDATDGAVGLLPVYRSPRPFEPSLDPDALFPGTGAGADATSSPFSTLCSAGGAGGYANHLMLRAGLAAPRTALAAHALIDAARDIAAAAGCARLLVPDLDRTQARWLAEIEAEATAASTREKAVLPIDWNDFAGYLAALPRKRRWQVRQERLAFAEGGTEVRDEPLAAVAVTLAPLLAQTQRRHGEAVDPAAAEFYLTMLAMTPGAVTRALVGYRKGEPVAFSAVVRCADTWTVRAVGRDYAAPDHAEYFNLTYYEPIARAAASGARAIDFGVGSLAAKRFRGCRLQPLRSLLIRSASHRQRKSPLSATRPTLGRAVASESSQVADRGGINGP
ncbi:acetyltransferase (GNAT) family protein [Mumia flava]|uniref:Acetyltransferase (GNAT) family protein n=1 Tax=Mumia flava TaxID=1348852 RepID=A0A2M9B843_9ACTN|nr:GNAT family N-acetyltransferase [Mumia flava]PJJ54091.1 acetyltransferase (GNAT) family protein [Mumia flava]